MTKVNYYEKWRVAKPSEQFYNTEPMKPQFPTVIGLIGATGTGKSNVLLNLIVPTAPCRESTYAEVHLFRGEDVPDVLYDLLREKIGDRFQMHPLSDLEEWIAARKAASHDEQEQCLVVLDDSLTDKEITKKVVKMPSWSRKAMCSFCFLAQRFTEVPIFMRTQVKYLCLMPGLSATDLTTMCVHRRRSWRGERHVHVRASSSTV
jgi:hypothetical protein